MRRGGRPKLSMVVTFSMDTTGKAQGVEPKKDYEVKSVKNSTEYSPRQHLSESQIKQLIDNDWEIKIV
jgi:hypothetical protein